MELKIFYCLEYSLSIRPYKIFKSLFFKLKYETMINTSQKVNFIRYKYEKIFAHGYYL